MFFCCFRLFSKQYCRIIIDISGGKKFAIVHYTISPCLYLLHQSKKFGLMQKWGWKLNLEFCWFFGTPADVLVNVVCISLLCAKVNQRWTLKCFIPIWLSWKQVFSQLIPSTMLFNEFNFEARNHFHSVRFFGMLWGKTYFNWEGHSHLELKLEVMDDDFWMKLRTFRQLKNWPNQ